MANNAGSLNDNLEDGKKVTINAIDRVKYVARLPKFWGSFRGIWPYGGDNLYPQKVKAIAQRSSTTWGAVNTYSSFISGDGFIGMDTIVNSEGQTAWDLHRFACFQYALFGGFLLHLNFDLNGAVCEINPINFEFGRRSNRNGLIVVNDDWERHLPMSEKKFEYKDFDPKAAVKDIEEKGIQAYEGQVYYYTPNKEWLYPLPPWDSAMDDAQFEAEAKLYSLSNIQNDYSLSGIFAYPKPLEDEEEIRQIKESFRGDKGSANAGGIKVVGTIPGGDLSNHNWFTPIGRNDIDSLHKQQKEDARFNIYAAMRQPPILSGVATSGMFNRESFKDAGEFYNEITESERKDLERVWRGIYSASSWDFLSKMEIKPKAFNRENRENRENTNNKP